MKSEAEVVVEIINEILLTKTGHQLKEVEKLVIQGAWEAKTYSQIAENCKYSLGYIKQAAAPRLWKLLSEILEQDISKTNFRVAIERRYQNQLEDLSVEDEEIKTTKIIDTIPHPFERHEIPKANPCYGRTKELALLKKWLIGDRCRLLGIVGIGGIGKTTLALSCVEEVRDQFEVTIWQDLPSTISVSKLTTELIQLISPQHYENLPQGTDELISMLLANLRRHKCLIVLDTITAIAKTGAITGNNEAENYDFGKLLTRLGQESHQSCLMFLAREKPREIAILEGEERPVRSLTLKGLGSEAKELLKAKKLLDPDRWEELIQIYRGNPLALKIVASTIKELFDSKVAAFLRQKTIIFGELNDLLDEQFECLSELETEILYWLAVQENAISLSKLSYTLRFISSQAKLLEALESLCRRSLVTRELVEEEIVFSLAQPIVKQYIIERICEKICQEICTVSKSQKVEQLGLLRTLALTDELSNLELKKSLIIQLIINQLCRIIKDESLVEEKLTKILSLISGKSFLVVGYTKQNLESLITGLHLNFNNVSVFNSIPST